MRLPESMPVPPVRKSVKVWPKERVVPSSRDGRKRHTYPPESDWEANVAEQSLVVTKKTVVSSLDILQRKLKRKGGGKGWDMVEGAGLRIASIPLLATGNSSTWTQWCRCVIVKSRSITIYELQKSSISSSEWNVSQIWDGDAITLFCVDSGGASSGNISKEVWRADSTGDGVAAERGWGIVEDGFAKWKSYYLKVGTGAIEDSRTVGAPAEE